jgi:hypothetical protein
MFFLPEGQTGESWEPSRKQRSFGNWGALAREALFTFSLESVKFYLIFMCFRIWSLNFYSNYQQKSRFLTKASVWVFTEQNISVRMSHLALQIARPPC